MLKLGTGNALAWVLGNQARAGRPGVVSDLKRIATEGGRSTLRLLDVEGSLTPFAGLGIDAICLDHYNETKRALARSPLTRRLSTGPAAYMISTLGRSLPEFLLRGHPWVRIVNEGAACVRMGMDDRPISEHPEGAILYDGPSRLVAMSTIPYWGFGARIFPFADERDDRFALRVCDVSSLEVTRNIGAIWRGKYRNERTVHDFLCERIAIHYEAPMALQVGGDVVGRRTVARARLAARSRWWTITHHPRSAPIDRALSDPLIFAAGFALLSTPFGVDRVMTLPSLLAHPNRRARDQGFYEKRQWGCGTRRSRTRGGWRGPGVGPRIGRRRTRQCEGQ